MTDELAPQGETVEPTQPAPPADTFDAFLDGIDAIEPEADVPAPEAGITLRSSGGGSGFIPTTEPMSVQAIIERQHLSTGAGVEYYVNGMPVDREFVVGPGGTLTVVTSVKGG